MSRRLRRGVLLTLAGLLVALPASADLLTPEEGKWVRECMDRLGSNAPRVRRSAEGALIGMGPAILPAVVANLKRVKGRAAQSGLMRVLLGLGRSTVLQELTRMARDAKAGERKRIQALMSRLGDSLGPGEPLTLQMAGAVLTDWTTIPAGTEHELSRWPTVLVRGEGTVQATPDTVTLTPAAGEAHTVKRETPRAVPIRIGGNPVPVLVYHKVDRWYAASGSILRGSIRTITLELWDVDLDGRFDGPKDMARVAPAAWQLLGSDKKLFHADRVIQLQMATDPKAAALSVRLVVDAPPDVLDPAHIDFLQELHAWRARHGLGPLTYDSKRSRACMEHSNYLALNDGKKGVTGGGNSHDQDPNLPGATPAGAEAGSNSVLRSTGLSGTHRAIAGTMLHRIAWLAPTGSAIGIGSARQGRAEWCSIWTERSDAETDARLVTVPPPGDSDTPAECRSEWPSPDAAPDWYQSARAYPVSVTYVHLGLRSPKLTLLRRGPDGHETVPVPARTWSPEAPIAKIRSKNRGTIFLMASRPLERGVSYWAVFEAQGAQSPLRYAWTFKAR